MIINEIDSLRTWLISKLTPMCDADPHALAKYVIALIKKDKPQEELKSECNNQLEVFLQKETDAFVNLLFDTLRNESYIAGKENTNKEESSRDKPKDLRRRLQRSPIRHRSRSRSRSPYGRRQRRVDYDNRRRSPPYNRRRINRSISPRRSSPWRRSPRRGSPRRSPRRRRSWSRSRSSRSRSKSVSSSSSSSRSPERKVTEDILPKKKIRCWDYDQKGFCVRGDSCAFDHGTNPVVLDESVLPSSVVSRTTTVTTPAINPSVAPPKLPPLPRVIGPPLLPPFMLNHPPPPMPPVPPGVPPPRLINPLLPQGPPPGYNPEAPSINYNPQAANIVSLANATNTVPSAVTGNTYQRKRVVTLTTDDMLSQPAVKKPSYQPNPNRFVANPVGTTNRIFNPNNSKLMIKKIPPTLNNITKLNEHFSKFGAINNIQVNFEGDLNTALVEFANVHSARKAKGDTDAVMNNRFIQVHWYNTAPNNVQNNTQHRIPPKERLGTVALPSQLKYTAPSTHKNKLGGPIVNSNPLPKPDFIQHQNEITQQELDENDARKKILMARQATKQKQVNHHKLVIERKVKLQKERQELIKKQIQQQKLLLQRIDANKNMSQKEKSDILKKLKWLTASIENLRKEIHSPAGSVSPEIVKQKKAKAQKEVLDAELDLYNASSAGEDTMSLKRKLNQLQVEAQSLDIINSHKSWSHGGRGSHHGGHLRAHPIRQQQRQFNTIDRRPRELNVAGFHAHEKDEILTHFANFGEIETFSFKDEDTSCLIKFKTRSQAENTLTQAVSFKNRSLAIGWHIPATTQDNVAKTEETKPLPAAEEREVTMSTLVVIEPKRAANGDGTTAEEKLVVVKSQSSQKSEEVVKEENKKRQDANESQPTEPADSQPAEPEKDSPSPPTEEVSNEQDNDTQFNNQDDLIDDGAYDDEIDEEALLAGDYEEDEETDNRAWRH